MADIHSNCRINAKDRTNTTISCWKILLIFFCCSCKVLGYKQTKRYLCPLSREMGVKNSRVSDGHSHLQISSPILANVNLEERVKILLLGTGEGGKATIYKVICYICKIHRDRNRHLTRNESANDTSVWNETKTGPITVGRDFNEFVSEP